MGKRTDWPKVTLVIITYNEADHVERCLQSIVDMDYPQDRLEVLCIDSNSTDKTRALIERFPLKKKLVVIDNYVRAPSLSITIGFEMTKTKYVFPFGGDAVFGKQFIKKAVEMFEHDTSDKIVNINGPAREFASDQPSMIKELYARRFESGQKVAEADLIYPKGGGIYRLDLLRKAGLSYDERLSREDEVDMGIRIVAAGYKFKRLQEIMFYHESAYGNDWQTMKTLVSVARRTGQARALMWKKYTDLERRFLWLHIKKNLTWALIAYAVVLLAIVTAIISLSVLVLYVLGLGIAILFGLAGLVVRKKMSWQLASFYLTKKIIIDSAYVVAIMFYCYWFCPLPVVEKRLLSSRSYR